MVGITNQCPEDISGRERVRAVVETLNGPLTITEIADKADASQSTAKTELERLKRDKWVRETIVVRQ
jgi:DNA-binding IclR family transcriptional regulator